jgi:serine/threonine protein kinase/tetratricopeptide (TPR) repeat protein
MSESPPDIETRPGDELLAELADDFLRRHRAGERPSVDEYASRHPELADRIRELFPAAIVMEQPPFGATIDLGLPTERVGATIGRYKLLEQIGAGGMGIVFMAEQQEPVRRKVALKVIKPGMDTRQVIARFEAERQALAVMDHPSIARVLDAGTTQSGHPYFVMELVRGVPITSYCDENNLPVRDRLELFASVCQAIQHAHTKGIIHRDIKPTNILVTRQDGRPVVKIIDFGVAKAMGQQLTEKTLFTNFAQMIGTPLYMSPEQAEQSGVDIDTRSDIFSLGVLLYELLTGSTPVDAEQLKRAAFDEIRRIIREDEPQTPSARISGSNTLPAIAAHRHIEPARLSNLVRGELDWIVMKALEKDRDRRYETANAFATDLLHYLNDEPVQACPPSPAYRFRKFSRRNRVALVTVALVASSLVLGTVASTWQAIRATRAEGLAEDRLIAETKARTEADNARAAEAEQRRLAEAERAKAEAQRAVAEANYQKAHEAVDKYFTLVSESKLLDVPGLQPLRKELLESALLFYQGSAVERTDDPAVLADLAVTYLRVALINSTIDRNDDAVAATDQALKVIDRLRSEFPDQREPLRRLGGYWKGLRRAQISVRLPRNPLAAFQTLVRLVETWEELAVQFPDDAGFRSDLAASYWFIGYLLAGSGQPANGVRYFAKAKPLLLQLTQEVPDQPEYRADLARIHEALAGVGRAQDAEAECRAALVLREQLVEEFPESPQFRYELCNSLQGYIPYVRKRDPVEAGKLANHFIELGESLVRAYPNMDLYRFELTNWKIDWLATIAASGDQRAINEALTQIDKFIAELANDGDHQNLNELAWSTVASVDVDERIAAAAVRAALRACELRPHEPEWLNTLGVAQYRKGDYVTAIESLARSRSFDDYRSSSMPVTGCYFRAMAHAKLGHGEQAEKWFRAADLWMALFAATDEELNRYRAEAIDVVGVEAEPMISKSATPETEQELLRLCLAADLQGHWMYHWMGVRLAEQGAWAEADVILTQAAASLTENPMALFHHALVRLKVGDREGYRRACATMCERFGQVEDPFASDTIAWTCGLAPEALGDMSVPLAHAQKCAELEPQNAQYSCALGLLLLRCGRHEDAVSQFKGSIALLESQNNSTFKVVYPRVLLAMTHWQLGHEAEARKWLSEAQSGLEQEPLEKMHWNRRATVELLLAEAEQMIPSGD